METAEAPGEVDKKAGDLTMPQWYRWADKKKGQSRADNREGETNSWGRKTVKYHLITGNLAVPHITADNYELHIFFTKQLLASTSTSPESYSRGLSRLAIIW